MSNKAGRVFVVSSPSGGGKTTIVEQLLKRIPELKRSVSVTTRQPRVNEKEGEDYTFVSAKDFDVLRQKNELLEWAEVHGAFYGTPKKAILDALDAGKCLVLSIDVQGAERIRQFLGERSTLIFLMPPSIEDLRERLLSRNTETQDSLNRRLAAAKKEMACAVWYDEQIVNDDLDRAVDELTRRVQAHMGAVNV